MDCFMKQKERQEQQEMKLPYEAPQSEWIELEVEQPMLDLSNDVKPDPGFQSFREGRN